MPRKTASQNPFVISGPIPRECFCDRERESEDLIRLLSNGNNVVLLSDRRMGKTSLVDFCFADERIRGNFLTASIDILPATSLEEMATILADGIVRAVAPLGKRAVTAFLQELKSLEGTVEFDPRTGLPSFSLGFSSWKKPEASLQEIFLFLESQKRPCLIAIDEFQQVANFEEKNAEALLRSLVQKTSGCNFVFAGSRRHLIQEMFLTYARPFYQSASMIELKPIPASVYATFAGKMFEKHGKTVDEDAVARLSEELGGNTFCLQSVMNAAFSMTKKGAFCGGPAIEAALQGKVSEKLFSYREILSRLSLSQKALLFAVAREKEAGQTTSAAFIEKHRLRSASAVQAARKKLLQMDLITESEGRYRMTDKFFEYAVRHSLFGVLGG